MTEDEKDEVVKEAAWERLDWGFNEEIHHGHM